MPFAVCYYHFVWSTRDRDALITPTLAPFLYDVVKRKSNAMKCKIMAVNAMPDHIHIAATLAVTISVADWVSRIKGGSSYDINQTFPRMDTTFRWQSSYGVQTFGTRQVDLVVSYIQNQQKHHQAQSTYAYLERTDTDT